MSLLCELTSYTVATLLCESIVQINCSLRGSYALLSELYPTYEALDFLIHLILFIDY